jgi:transposase
MKKYSEDFKREAVKKIQEGQSVASLSRELGVSEGVLHNWKSKDFEGASDLEKENLSLRKKLREVEEERDILKKAALIFGKKP